MVSDDVRGTRAWRIITEWWWRIAVAAYGILTILRGLEVDGPRIAILQAAQFGSIALGLVGLLVLEYRLRGWTRPHLRPRLPRTPAEWFVAAIGAFLAVAAVATALGDDIGYGMSQLAITVLMLGFVLATAGTRWRRDRILIRGDLAWWVGLAAVAHTFGILVFVLRPDLVTLYAGSRFFGIFTNPNFCGIVAGAALGLTTLLLADRRSGMLRPWLIAAIVPLAAGLYLSGSRTGLIAAAAAIAVTLFFSFRRWFARVIVVVAALAIVAVVVSVPVTLLRGPDTLLFEPVVPVESPSAETTPTVTPPDETPAAAPDPTPETTPEPTAEPTVPADPGPEPEDLDVQSSGRLTLARAAIHSWLESPVLGHGYRSSASQLDGLEPHNLVLQVLVETGVLGAIPFLGAVAALAIGLLRRPRDLLYLGPVVGVFATENLTSTALGWGGPVALITWLVLAGVFVWRIDQTVERTPRRRARTSDPAAA